MEKKKKAELEVYKGEKISKINCRPSGASPSPARTWCERPSPGPGGAAHRAEAFQDETHPGAACHRSPPTRLVSSPLPTLGTPHGTGPSSSGTVPSPRTPSHPTRHPPGPLTQRSGCATLKLHLKSNYRHFGHPQWQQPPEVIIWQSSIHVAPQHVRNQINPGHAQHLAREASV